MKHKRKILIHQGKKKRRNLFYFGWAIEGGDIRTNIYIYRLVPALAVGFEDVKKRMEAQEKQAQAQMAILKETEDKINKLRNIDALATAKKLDEYKMRHMELTQRVIWVNIKR